MRSRPLQAIPDSIVYASGTGWRADDRAMKCETPGYPGVSSLSKDFYTL